MYEKLFILWLTESGSSSFMKKWIDRISMRDTMLITVEGTQCANYL